MYPVKYNTNIPYNAPEYYDDTSLIYPVLYNSDIEYNAVDYYYNDIVILEETGFTYTYHLNRLAGTIINSIPQYDAQGAANIWAGTEGYATVGALNALYAERNGGVNLGLDLQGILNALAGTSGYGINKAAAEIVS